MFVNENDNKRRKFRSKTCVNKTKYGTRRLIKEFRRRNWKRLGLEDFLHRLRDAKSI